MSRSSSCVAVLAAGASKRMGSPKQLATFEGKTLVRRACETALDARVGDVCLVTGAYAEFVEEEVRDLPLCILRNMHWEEGQSASIRLAVSHCNAHAYRWLSVLPVDMPFVTSRHLRRLFEESLRTGSEMVASVGKAGHMAPCTFASSAFPTLSLLRGDRGAMRVLRDPDMRNRVSGVPFSDEAMAFDVDTPIDLNEAEAMAR